ncbi:hypothetical protein QU516_12135 [Moellerella wisconsensis]|uniref:hypothetical protein n=1 Tax=Moellerella wisconsensis TaxID=158849 RepID=UPI0025B01134|nr:hypothetical protein [Moellerella wisconsensis]WJW81373.1 hypothetical protein QU516_12135 [Moellerella wisconsensis]
MTKNINLSVISQQLINTWNNNKEPYLVKYINSKYLYLNNAFRKLINLPDNIDIIGLTDADISSVSYFLHQDYIKLEKKVHKELRRVSSVESHIFHSNNPREIYICDRTPLFDNEHKLFAVSFHFSLYSNFSSNYYIDNQLPSMINIQDPDPEINMTSEEIATLTLFSHLMTPEEIATLLDLDNEDVSEYLTNICFKLKASSLDELSEYCQEHQFNSNVPDKLMPQGTHELT